MAPGGSILTKIIKGKSSWAIVESGDRRMRARRKEGERAAPGGCLISILPSKSSRREPRWAGDY
jgi:hypothetical protein